MQEIERKINAILKIIADAKEPIGSAEISKKLQELGIDLTERAVRYHLKIMGDRGLVKGFWKEGRMITQKGVEELENALVSDKIGLVSSQIEAMSYLMDFDLEKKVGSIILNVSYFQKKHFAKAVKIMREVFSKKFSMGNRVLVAMPGEEIGGMTVPKGKVGFGTICTINLNGILLKHSIPVESKFGGVLQIEGNQPRRFTDLIGYAGSTLDPHEIFIKSNMTSVREAAKGSGKILAGLREIPAIAKQSAEVILAQTDAVGLGTALCIGWPSQPVLGISVGVEKVGLVVLGGLNPVAAAMEAGIIAESKALVALADYSQLIKFEEL